MSQNSDSFFRSNNVGFVYFNSPDSNTSHVNDSADYLSFSGSFTPPRNSSPNYRFGRQNRFNRSFDRYQNNYRRDFGYSPNNSNNRSFLSPHNNSRGKRNKKPVYNRSDIDKYYNPRMSEDPWKELQLQLEKRANENIQDTETETENSQLESTADGDSDHSDHSHENVGSGDDN